jgi:hypothetical protein
MVVLIGMLLLFFSKCSSYNDDEIVDFFYNNITYGMIIILNDIDCLIVNFWEEKIFGSWGYSLHGESNSTNRIWLDFDVNVTSFIDNPTKLKTHFNKISHLNVNKLVGGKFRIAKELGHGSFGLQINSLIVTELLLL